MSDAGNERIVSRLKKLLALARQGVGGEKQNAEQMLNRLLTKHGMTLADLDDTNQPQETMWFKVKGKEEKTVFVQVAESIVGERDIWTSRLRPGQLGVDLTRSEWVEVEVAFDIHRKAFAAHMAKQKKLALAAYIHKNDLYSKSASDESNKPSTLSPDDVLTIVQMMGGLSRTQIHKQIGAAKNG